MKKYGIEIYEKDNTPGFRCKDTWEKWFESREERDRAYEAYINPHVRYQDMCLPQSYVEHTYTKIEKEA